MSTNEPGADARLAAAFLIEALDLADEVATVSRELSLVDRDQVVTVFAAEFESSVGPAAFLVYVYRLEQVDDEGHQGHDRFRDDLSTLETAARLDTPGPRAIGHTRSDTDALILATSPAVFRALRGVPDPVEPRATRTDPGTLRKTREEQSLRLIRLLKSANRAADAWLAAIEASPEPSLVPEETELSLFLNDEESIKQLLRALNKVLNTAGSPRA